MKGIKFPASKSNKKRASCLENKIVLLRYKSKRWDFGEKQQLMFSSHYSSLWSAYLQLEQMRIRIYEFLICTSQFFKGQLWRTDSFTSGILKGLDRNLATHTTQKLIHPPSCLYPSCQSKFLSYTLSKHKWRSLK